MLEKRPPVTTHPATPRLRVETLQHPSGNLGGRHVTEHGPDRLPNVAEVALARAVLVLRGSYPLIDGVSKLHRGRHGAPHIDLEVELHELARLLVGARNGCGEVDGRVRSPNPCPRTTELAASCRAAGCFPAAGRAHLSGSSG